ncbi:receptor-type tyrosine-protein phosphatase gamma-like isoform X2 [Anneissia japonica]|uniref:receptor-type tyrosine-protein phosphatase gamma-like isoform X2 n=1 Tax=Anneissia japonica TaxID=1529436 RepID=UPI0014256CA1|nr:receptor-type tyrosine-protein phosphatase gamma-like isoform X2 [Anneissia japonica]
MSSFQLNMYSLFILLFICDISVSAKWGYGPDNTGPAFWKTNYNQCGGVSQSPINLDDTVAEVIDLGNFHLEGYFDAPEPGVMKLRNNGHTASVDLLRNYTVSGGGLGGTYKALQFHFHWGAKNMRGSEHALNAKFYPAELHIVHWDNTTFPDVSTAIKSPRGLAVLGFFMDICTPTNPAMEKFGVDIPRIERESDVSIPMTQLIRLGDLIKGAKMDDYYRYNGSLTTPGCWESVVWTVFKRPICVSPATISRFRMLKGTTPQRVVAPILDNFRPIQALNSRTLIHSVRPGSRHSDFCQQVRVPMCQEVGFSMTSFPNMFGHQTQEEAGRELERWRVLIDSACSHRLQNFLCSAYIPACDGGASFIPCRETCRDVQKNCAVAMLKTRIDWPKELTCTPLPGLGKTNHDCLAETRPPLSIKQLTISQISRNRVKLSWIGPTHTRTEVRHYEITMSNRISGLMHKETVSVSRDEFNTGALRPGIYIFTIKAVNYLGDGPTETRSINVKDIIGKYQYSLYKGICQKEDLKINLYIFIMNFRPVAIN